MPPHVWFFYLAHAYLYFYVSFSHKEKKFAPPFFLSLTWSKCWTSSNSFEFWIQRGWFGWNLPLPLILISTPFSYQFFWKMVYAHRRKFLLWNKWYGHWNWIGLHLNSNTRSWLKLVQPILTYPLHTEFLLLFHAINYDNFFCINIDGLSFCGKNLKVIGYWFWAKKILEWRWAESYSTLFFFHAFIFF